MAAGSSAHLQLERVRTTYPGPLLLNFGVPHLVAYFECYLKNQNGDVALNPWPVFLRKPFLKGNWEQKDSPYVDAWPPPHNPSPNHKYTRRPQHVRRGFVFPTETQISIFYT